MDGLRVAYVLATSEGGTGRHVAMLAAGCAAAGLSVTVYGPPGTGRRFFPGRGGAGDAVAGDRAAGQVAARDGPAAFVPVAARDGPAAFVPVGIAHRPRPARDLAAVLRLRRLLVRGRCDVVHAHGMRAGALTAMALAGVRHRPPLLVTVHNAPPAGGGAALVHALLERVVARRADAVACVSGDLTARMGRLGARDAGRALVAAPPAAPPPAAEVARLRAELGGGRHPIVLAVGRLTAQKGFATLLAAATAWQERDPPPVVVIAGDGPLERSLRAEAGRRGVAVRFLGRREDVPALLAAADVVAVPSTWEGQPLTVQEALRSGRPTVAFRVGGIPGLTGEDGALLVPPGDTRALAAAVLATLDDPDLAAALAAGARARAAVLPAPADAVAAALAAYARLAGRKAALTRGGGAA